MKLKFIILLYLLGAFTLEIQAQKKVYKVRIKGNQLITDSAVQDKLKIKEGRAYRRSFVEEDVKNLFSMGYFNNIIVRSQSKPQGLIITYHIEEKPRIDSIVYKGSRVFSSKKLEEMSLLKKYEFLNIQKLKKGIKSIKDGYQEKGYFLAEVSYKVQNVQSSKKVKLIIQIKEHEKTLIKKISFIGNHSISSKKIKSFLANKEDSILSFLTNSSVYTEDKLMRDQQVIRFLYMEEGFVEMKLAETQVSLSPDKKGLYISFSIMEGRQFKVGQLDYAGDLIFSKVELRKGQNLETDKVFIYSQLQKDLNRIQTQYGDKGYAFANVIPQFHTKEDKIHVLFNIQKGLPVHIRRIQISGNHFTRDKVIRRLVAVSEEDLYNASEILKSKNSIQRLGYFEEVDFFNKPVRGREQLIDLEISVKEREGEYGVFQFGAGYSTSGGFNVNGKLSRENLFGNGTTLDFQLALLPAQKEFVLSSGYLDPYFLDTDWYFGVNVFSFLTGGAFWDFTKKYVGNWFVSDSKQMNFKSLKKLGLSDSAVDFLLNLEDREFSKNQWGGRITLGRWMTDTAKLISKFGFEDVRFLKVSDADLFSTKEAEGFRSVLGGVLDYDDRNDRFFPKHGMSANLSLEYTYQAREQQPPLSFTQMDAWWSYYINLKTLFSFLPQAVLDWSFLENVVIKNKIQYGRLDLISKNESIPFDKLYLLGGPLSLRGFRNHSVGKMKYSQNINEIAQEIERVNAEQKDPQKKIAAPIPWRPYGGSQQLLYNIEVRFPLILKFKLFGLAFFDIGNAQDQWQDLLSLRKDAGFGVFLVTPFAPISLRWGIPLNPKEEYGESSFEFHFNLGFDF